MPPGPEQPAAGGERPSWAVAGSTRPGEPAWQPCRPGGPVLPVPKCHPSGRLLGVDATGAPPWSSIHLASAGDGARM
eukprot:6905151-Lingulodinium_polyedra.AAC.1